MNKAKLKSYAPQARKDFIAAVEARAHSLGLSEMGGTLDIAPSEKKGDVTLIAGQAWPAKVHDQRQRLIKRMKKDGFAQTVEAVAYTWFNRFAALRYMEIHDYLDHGYRVLSSREGGLPEIIAHATDVAGSLPGLNTSQIADMKLAGNQDGELYRLLLVAQCNALSKAMPFLFEHIDDESELLLPGNLERTDSVVAKLVESIAEEDWSEVEVIGWLYQFYISEKKDSVIGKVVKSEDIPAATQLFTPNWIVQYLVQNSVGRLWLMANPGSTLKNQWKYYIEPAEQTPEVQAQLDALIQTRMGEDGGSLNPETITVLDPACGSGHILVEAYEVLKAIYLERGYQARAIPRLILEKNLYGLDIDDRAAQMAGFALMMKARADDRRLLDSPIKLNVLSLQESKGLDEEELTRSLELVGRLSPQRVTRQTSIGFGENELFPETQPQMSLDVSVTARMSEDGALTRPTIALLIKTFAHAKTFGSLIQIPEALASGLPTLMNVLGKAIQSGDAFAQAAAQDLLPLVAQAVVLAMKFDAVVANPPYMGPKGMNSQLKEYAKEVFPAGKADLFAMFIGRGFEWSKALGFNSMVTMQSWMFLSSFEAMRESVLRERTILTMAHFGARAFSEISGEVVQTTAFVLLKQHFGGYKPAFFRLVDGVEEQKSLALRTGLNRFASTVQDDFTRIPGSPIAYWATRSVFESFSGARILDISISDGQNITANNDQYVRFWWEVDFLTCGRDKKWLTYCKGGGFRKWYGNIDNVVDWSPEARSHFRSSDRCRIIPEYLWYKEGVTWSRVASKDSPNSFRLLPKDSTFDKVGSSIFVENEADLKLCLGILNSAVSNYLIPMLNPSIDLQVRDVRNIPFLTRTIDVEKVKENVTQAIAISESDWDCIEVSMRFNNPIVGANQASTCLKDGHRNWEDKCQKAIANVTRLEEENNRIFIDSYGLQDELSPVVPDDQITLARADREKDCQYLISYAVGCMMGRYSLDEPGLIYAHAGNVGFDATPYKSFPADTDGIVPISDEFWFEDDASNRVREFLNAVWGAETLEVNMNWLAESLGKKGTETPEETIRRYLSNSFYKDHLQTYKKRPIYWHFSSGKQCAFQALVYLHRYHEGTLARMRAEYVVPLTGKMQSRIEMLEKDRDAATSTAAGTKLAKQIESLKKKHVELLAYDEKLRHYADMRIQLDLDDGVKVNYGKFGDLLAEVKAVTGGAGDE